VATTVEAGHDYVPEHGVGLAVQVQLTDLSHEVLVLGLRAQVLGGPGWRRRTNSGTRQPLPIIPTTKQPTTVRYLSCSACSLPRTSSRARVACSHCWRYLCKEEKEKRNKFNNED
jgi:hypothetical protein